MLLFLSVYNITDLGAHHKSIKFVATTRLVLLQKI